MTTSPLSYFKVGRWLVITLKAIYIASSAFFVSPTLAGQLEIMPTRLTVSADDPLTTMFATNAESIDASYQVTVFSWTQQPDGSDHLDATREVLANPAIFTLHPGERQVIRFGLRAAASSDSHNYRVVLQEIPHAKQQATGIQTLLKISVPIFVPAANPVEAESWALETGTAGSQLIVRNKGNVHVQITGLTIEGAGSPALSMHCSVYALPGSTRTIKIAPSRPLLVGVAYHVHIDTDQGPRTADLRADPIAAPPVG